MDRRQLVAQRAREYFADRVEDVAHMVRQDRQELRGWEEPAHMRAVVRRTIYEAPDAAAEAIAATAAAPEIGRTAGEPDRGQQREALGLLLEAGAAALDKLSRSHSPDLTSEETLGLESVLLLYGRPAVLVRDGRLASVPPFWNLLEDQREDIEMTQQGVGRLELLGHPEYDWAGTGFLANDNCLMTTRRTAEIFAENRTGAWQFRPGITAWMDYGSQVQPVASAGYQVRSVIGIHEVYDLALLEVDPPQQSAGSPTTLALASQPPAQLENRPVYLVGYPVRDARRNEPEPLTRIFRDVYNVKRVQPGTLHGAFQFRDVQLLQHNCAMLGESSGSVLIDLETHQVLGLHLFGRYLENGTAIPLWLLRDDPLLKKAGVTFAEATAPELELTASHLERLSRSRYWNEARATITNLYQRAFGGNGRG